MAVIKTYKSCGKTVDERDKPAKLRPNQKDKVVKETIKYWY